MREVYENLKRQAKENPLMTLGVAGATLTAVGKFVEMVGHARGSHAYARDVSRRIKNSK